MPAQNNVIIFLMLLKLPVYTEYPYSWIVEPIGIPHFWWLIELFDYAVLWHPTWSAIKLDQSSTSLWISQNNISWSMSVIYCAHSMLWQHSFWKWETQACIKCLMFMSHSSSILRDQLKLFNASKFSERRDSVLIFIRHITNFNCITAKHIRMKSIFT